MPTQITNSGVSLKIVTAGKSKYVTKSNILSVQVLTGTIIKIDIGRGALHNIYVNQTDVTVPSSTDVNDLRDQIHAMLQPAVASGGDASAANQVSQTTELTNIKNSLATLNTTVSNMNTSVNNLNTNISSLNATVNVVNDKVFYEPKMVDETNGPTVYKGFAVPGTHTNDPMWAILRVTNDDGIFSYHWAGGNKNFDKIWDNRTGYAYS